MSLNAQNADTKQPTHEGLFEIEKEFFEQWVKNNLAEKGEDFREFVKNTLQESENLVR